MNNNQTNSSRQYYLAQLLFWGVYLLMNVVFMVAYYNQVSRLSVAIFLVLSVLLFGISHGLRSLFHRYAKNWSLWKISLNLAWILPLASALAQALLFVIVSGLITMFSMNTAGVQRYSFGTFMGYIMNTCVMLVLWATFYLMRVEFRKRRDAEIAHWRLQAEVKESELQFLRSQINSHFLFNALNNLRSVIREDAERARTGLSDLATLLRGLMQINPANMVKLRDELEWVKGYLSLEQLQFEQRLQTRFHIDESLLDQEFPALIIQTLVENAVKHGIATCREGGVIELSIQRSGPSSWMIKVTNPCGQSKVHAGHGIGLKNARQRLQLAYGDKAQLQIDFGDTVTTTILLPL